ncbi:MULTISPECIES: hypothetical protein [Leptospira]|uniref:Uncharacterized protein n=4 Tax=Leptospira borgpetersenii TaxID=174 RepID=A0A0E3B2V6_LEPBO|nr:MULTISPECIES: hypothetical protein [Leptospira]EMO09368.1 hypothetical protein LEP1GSC137_2026 [Leptospira borgpetersenii str. Noumea 25]ALO24975.1 hypothetical protein LBBP_00635 [Leptospira borgpetersenii serovar Ballum]AMX57798.1 hypothetical protein LBK6_05365 [Leptospira borgpetersenii serovar Hardjo]AMX61031.1 hypothetical protein LBK9_05300 [Leptospira borgpetersenii serovar Hardjo]AMX64274.1 hypothetical protein LBK30_05330 [Leptospira borgpetersenii serovar Hardjo]
MEERVKVKRLSFSFFSANSFSILAHFWGFYVFKITFWLLNLVRVPTVLKFGNKLTTKSPSQNCLL